MRVKNVICMADCVVMSSRIICARLTSKPVVARRIPKILFNVSISLLVIKYLHYFVNL